MPTTLLLPDADAAVNGQELSDTITSWLKAVRHLASSLTAWSPAWNPAHKALPLDEDLSY